MKPFKRLHFTRQDALMLKYLHWYIWRFGYAPTRKELGEAMSIHESCASRRLHKLEQLGHVQLESAWRGIRLMPGLSESKSL